MCKVTMHISNLFGSDLASCEWYCKQQQQQQQQGTLSFSFTGAVGVIRVSKSQATWSSMCAPTLGRSHSDVISAVEGLYQPECWSPTSTLIQVSSLCTGCWEISKYCPKLIRFEGWIFLVAKKTVAKIILYVTFKLESLNVASKTWQKLWPYLRKQVRRFIHTNYKVLNETWRHHYTITVQFKIHQNVEIQKIPMVI